MITEVDPGEWLEDFCRLMVVWWKDRPEYIELRTQYVDVTMPLNWIST